MTETRTQSSAERPVKFELMASDDDSRFQLEGRTEIQFLLKAMMKSGDLITAYFNEGNDFLLTALLEVDDAGLMLDYGASAEMNRKAQAANRLVLIAAHDKVKVQFALPHLKPATHNGRPAFAAPLPERVLRLQRRDYFRLTAPVAQPLKCRLSLIQEDGTRRAIEAQVLDISGGGIAIMSPPSGFEFAVDQVFENCDLELPEIGPVRSGLRVRNVFEVTLRNGAKVKRSGCQFVGLPGNMLNRIERYIMRVERERKARGA
jgi:c-di-GMP-binding flagellar brake protein YcgR